MVNRTVIDMRTLRGRKEIDSELMSPQTSGIIFKETCTKDHIVLSIDQVRNRRGTSQNHMLRTMGECRNQQETGTTRTSIASETSMKGAKARRDLKVRVINLPVSSVVREAAINLETQDTKVELVPLTKATNQWA